MKDTQIIQGIEQSFIIQDLDDIKCFAQFLALVHED
jgi:hypothetical protein